MARKPKPTHLKIIEGAYDKNPQRFNGDEPPAPPGWPKMPDYLDEFGRQKWQETCERLESLGMLSDVYADAIECYAAAYSGYRKCQEIVARTGPALISKDADGNVEVKRNAYSVELHKYREAMLKYESEFGFTPSSKSRLKAGEAATDEMELRHFGA